MQHYDLSFLPVGCLRPSFFPLQLLLNSLARYLRGTNKKVWTIFSSSLAFLLKSVIAKKWQDDSKLKRDKSDKHVHWVVKSNVEIKYSLRGSPLHPIPGVYCLHCALPPISSPRQTLNITNTVKTGPKGKSLLQGSIIFVFLIVTFNNFGTMARLQRPRGSLNSIKTASNYNPFEIHLKMRLCIQVCWTRIN